MLEQRESEETWHTSTDSDPMPVSKACAFTLSFKKLLNHSPTKNTLCQGPTLCSSLNSNILIPDTIYFNFVSVQFSHSVMSDSAILWTAALQASLSITNSQSLLKLMSIESVILSNHLILYRPLLLLPSIFPNIRVFSSESVLHIRWPKYWSFSFNISPSNEHSGLISFRMDWLDQLAVQGTLKSLLQHHSSKASILWHSAVFIVQLSHPYMTTGKTIPLIRQTFVGKVTSLLFNMLSRLVTAFLLRSNHLLILWLKSMSAVILEPKKLSLSLFPLFSHLFAMK